MQFLNTLALGLKPSETLAVKARAQELKAQGKEIIDLSTGEPDIDTPEHIKEGAIKALRDGKTKYTEVGGILELRTAIAEKLTNENKIPTEASTVVVCNGGKQALQELIAVTIQPGDEVLVQAPYWVSYPPMVTLAGGTTKIVHSKPENGFKLKPEELRAGLSSKTKAIIINCPSNPTGAAYTKQELQALCAVLADHPAIIISDEIYEKVTYGDFQFHSTAAAVPELRSRIVTVNGFSKAYSMTGWRVGYLTGPKEIVSAITKYQSQTTSNVCSIAQYAAVAALRGSQDFLKPMVASFDRRMNTALALIEQTPGLTVMKKPEGAFYLFIRFAELLKKSDKLPFKGSSELVKYLLDEAGVAAVQGEAFGDDQAFRVSVATSDEAVKRGFEKIKGAIERFSF